MSDQPTEELDEVRLVIEPAASPEQYAAIVAIMRTRNQQANEVDVRTEQILSGWRKAARREGLRAGIDRSPWRARVGTN